MTQKRKAELQRKLSMVAVPKPPEGLARRIKETIPDTFAAPPVKPARPRGSMMFGMKVAASVVLLITSVALSIQLLSRGEGPPAPSAKQASTDRTSTKSIAPQISDTAEVIVSLSDEVAPERRAALTAPPAIEATASSSRDQKPQKDAAVGTEARSNERPMEFAKEKKREADAFEEQAPLQKLDAVAPERQRRDEPISVTAAAPVAPSAAAPAPPAAPAPAPAVAQASRLESGAAKSVGNIASAAADRDTLFGLSVNANEFDRLVALIESGARPEPVDVEALVNHFAARPVPAAAGVSLEVEGSKEPLSADLAVLRFSIDATGKRGERVATDAELEVVVNRSVVLRQRLLGGGEELKATEGTIVGGSSATALLELRLAPGVSLRQEIASVRLRYREATGTWKTIKRSVRAADVRREWNGSSRRHRITTLAALWGESLEGGTGGTDLARAAEAFAAQDPNDERARALAAAATASSRLRSSGPTGSGR